MSNGSDLLTAWSGGLVAMASAALAVRLFPWGRREANPKLAALTVFAAVAFGSIWGALTLTAAITNEPVWSYLSDLADTVRYACWYVFLLTLLRPDKKAALPAGVAWLAPAALVTVAIGLTSQTLLAFQWDLGFDPTRLVLLGSMALSVLALMLVEQLFRNVSDDSLWNIKPLCLGLVGMFLFDLYVYSQAVLFNRPDVDALSMRGTVHALMVPLLLLSTTRRRDWIAKIQISRRVAFHSATLLMAGVYLIFISAVGYYVRFFGGEWGRALQIALVVSALVALMVMGLSGAVRSRLRVFVGKNFFRYRYDYREEWLRFTQALSARESPEEMGQQVVRGLANMLESPAGALWMNGATEPVFNQVARWNMPPCPAQEGAASALCQFMAQSGWVVNLDEYRAYPRRYGQLVVPDWLNDLPQAWLVVPLTASDELIGFVVLAHARAELDVNWEVNDLLKTAGRQAASFLAQMRATEALLEVRKFDAFNRMSAFVVHDLKNIVTQLSLMLKNAKRLHANPEFQQDMLLTVENSLDRMRQMMLQLREGATPPGTAVGVDLATVAERIASSSAGRGRRLELELVEKVTTRGHVDRLERIVGHVVQNAFDATDPAGRVWLKLDRSGGQARVEIGDTGHGMSADFVRDRLFKPFQTTKQAGMGIGAYESFLYVQELGGKLQVDSEPGKGTRVTFLLPVFELQTNSDLHSRLAS